jgi:hypothetical protein
MGAHRLADVQLSPVRQRPLWQASPWAPPGWQVPPEQTSPVSQAAPVSRHCMPALPRGTQLVVTHCMSSVQGIVVLQLPFPDSARQVVSEGPQPRPASQRGVVVRQGRPNIPFVTHIALRQLLPSAQERIKVLAQLIPTAAPTTH